MRFSWLVLILGLLGPFVVLASDWLTGARRVRAATAITTFAGTRRYLSWCGFWRSSWQSIPVFPTEIELSSLAFGLGGP